MVPPSFFPHAPPERIKTMKKQKNAPAPAPAITPDEDFRIAAYRESIDDMLDTYQRRIHDYGNSYAEARRKIPCYIAGKLYDKVSQLIALSRNGGTARVRNETIDNALLDLADYALREYVERRVDEADYDF